MSDLFEKILDDVRFLRHRYYRFQMLNKRADAIACIDRVHTLLYLLRDFKLELIKEKKLINKYNEKLDELLNIKGRVAKKKDNG